MTNRLAELDPNRCAVCGWPLKDSFDGMTCERGDCSMRPLPWPLYDRTRAVEEYGIHAPEKWAERSAKSSDTTRATDPNTHGWPEGKL